MDYAFYFYSEYSDSLLISSSTNISFISVHTLNTMYFRKDFVDVILPICTQHCSQIHENYMIQVSQLLGQLCNYFLTLTAVISAHPMVRCGHKI